jgi:2-keto-3-deoxy-L-rhamnonate aldolase RhmA
VLRAWREGGQTIGGWLTLNSTLSAEMMAHQGFDCSASTCSTGRSITPTR